MNLCKQLRYQEQEKALVCIVIIAILCGFVVKANLMCHIFQGT